MPVVYDSVASNGNSPQISRFQAGPTGNPVIGDPVPIRAQVTFQATANPNTDVSFQLPYAARIISIRAIQTVAPTGATSTLQAGSTQGGNDIATATDVKTTVSTVLATAVNGARPLTVANFASISVAQATGSVVWLRNVQTTETAVGTFLVSVEYVMA